MKRILLTSVLCLVSTLSFASGFQLWNQDAAGLGDYQAGAAATANSASTAFYNPAGLTHIHHQQIVATAFGYFPTVKFKGSVNSTGFTPDYITNGYENGADNALAGSFFYAYPFTSKLTGAFSVMAPYGSKVDFRGKFGQQHSNDYFYLYAINAGPSLGYQLLPTLSIGAGLDLQYEYLQVKGLISPLYKSKNTADSWQAGYHVGVLWQATQTARFGLTYHSAVHHSLTGESDLDVLGSPTRSNDLAISLTMPATTELAYFQKIKQFDLLASAVYTQWNSISQLKLKDSAGLAPGSKQTVIVNWNFANTWRFALGGQWHINNKWLLRTGGGFEQAPISSRYRTLSVPDGSRKVLSVGAAYQPTQAVRLDAGFAHWFLKKGRINSQTAGGGVVVSTTGNIVSHVDILGLQLTVDLV